MFETIEMRWFFDDIPLDADLHFHEHTELQKRTDWYSMPCNEFCGVKVREGKLEPKLLSETFGVRELPPLVGLLQAWRKWSLLFPPSDHPTEAELSSVQWLAVEKQRRLRRFAVTSEGVQPAATRPDNGCEFELTELRVGERRFWTVGFEAVGPREQLEDNLRQVASQIVDRGGLLLPFIESNSYGYAHWLSHL